MRLNQFLAKHTALSRRSADEAIGSGRVKINGEVAVVGQTIVEQDRVSMDDIDIVLQRTTTIMLNKPVKTICSTAQQGNVPTVYSLLPESLQHLSYLGRLDKDTSGLLIMSNDGDLIQRISHPSHKVDKQYLVQLDQTLSEDDQTKLEKGIMLDDGISALQITGRGRDWKVTIHEGRNRQIRRTFEALGYTVTKLRRQKIGKLDLGNLRTGEYRSITNEDVL
jgi:23S rRNA pseudouridine2605 synthase